MKQRINRILLNERNMIRKALVYNLTNQTVKSHNKQSHKMLLKQIPELRLTIQYLRLHLKGGLEGIIENLLGWQIMKEEKDCLMMIPGRCLQQQLI